MLLRCSDDRRCCTLLVPRFLLGLLDPLRRWVQHVVDRRFNRARYDAEATVAMFATRLKDAVDLDSVRDDLASAVHKALEPAHISVWITPPH